MKRRKTPVPNIRSRDWQQVINFVRFYTTNSRNVVDELVSSFEHEKVAKTLKKYFLERGIEMKGQRDE